MNIPILASAQARNARSHLGLSQAKVAKATGISRTKLALFEVGKYILDDATLRALRDFYGEQGYDFGPTPAKDFGSHERANREKAPAVPEEPAMRIVDGFAVPPGSEPEEIEAALAELTENDQKIEDLATQASRVGWFSDEPDTAGRDEILRLMARNYHLIRRVQGADLLRSTAEYSAEAKPTHGALAAALLDV